MSKGFSFYTNWEKGQLKCSCLANNPNCTKTNECEVIQFTYDPYADVEECMKSRSYKRRRGALRQVDQDG